MFPENCVKVNGLLIIEGRIANIIILGQTQINYPRKFIFTWRLFDVEVVGFKGLNVENINRPPPPSTVGVIPSIVWFVDSTKCWGLIRVGWLWWIIAAEVIVLPCGWYRSMGNESVGGIRWYCCMHSASFGVWLGSFDSRATSNVKVGGLPDIT